MAICGGTRNTKAIGSFLMTYASKIPQLHQLGRSRVKEMSTTVRMLCFLNSSYISGSSFSAANGSPDSIWLRIWVSSCIEDGYR